MTFHPDDFGIQLRDYFHFDEKGSTPGTYWFHPDFDCWLTADHVHQLQNQAHPYFVTGAANSGAGRLDAAIFGAIKGSAQRPREPRDDEIVRVYGSPQGSGRILERRGKLRFRLSTPRVGFSMTEWWGLIENLPGPVENYDGEDGVLYQPVSTGMSGGLVLAEDGPIGVLVTAAPPQDYDNDGNMDQAFTFVALSDVYDAFHDPSSVPQTDPLVFAAKGVDALPSKYADLADEPAPLMLLEALRHLGTLEEPGTANNPVIIAWGKEVDTPPYTWISKMFETHGDAVPWCGLFMGMVARRCNKPLPNNPLRALAWADWGEVVDHPELGDVVTFTRTTGGHVGIYVGEDDQCYHVLGGNQDDSVSIKRIRKSRFYSANRYYAIGKPANVRRIFRDPSGTPTDDFE